MRAHTQNDWIEAKRKPKHSTRNNNNFLLLHIPFICHLVYLAVFTSSSE